ncbi:hypothetical protein AAXE64_27530 [Priestia megaterium]
MDKFSYFHICDHRIKRSSRIGEVVTLDVENSGDLIDIIINGGVVLKIFEVRVLNYDKDDAEIIDFYYDNYMRTQTYDSTNPGESYYDEKEAFIINYGKFFKVGQNVSEPLPPGYYEPTLHNRIKWSIKPPIKYRVTAEVKYNAVEYDYHALADCPVCGGRGWFVDIFNQSGEFKTMKGVLQIAQRVIKDFLTEEGSHILDIDYGTKVKRRLIENSNDDEQLFNTIRMEVSTIEDAYLTQQQDRIMELSDEEVLQNLLVEDVSRSTKNPLVVIVKLRIITPLEDEIFHFTI